MHGAPSAVVAVGRAAVQDTRHGHVGAAHAAAAAAAARRARAAP